MILSLFELLLGSPVKVIWLDGQDIAIPNGVTLVNSPLSGRGGLLQHTDEDFLGEKVFADFLVFFVPA